VQPQWLLLVFVQGISKIPDSVLSSWQTDWRG